MTSIHDIKKREVTDTPLLLFECRLRSGSVERWSTHHVEIADVTYRARVLKHNLFDLNAASEEGVDGISTMSLTLANADSYFSQVERSSGWKGAKLNVTFLFFDVVNGAAASEASVVFKGLCNPPDEITETGLRLTFTSRLSLQRALMPEIRIQRRCPWVFPVTAEQRVEAVDGGAKGKYSQFFRCGYSPEITGGAGTFNAGAPFASCDYTRLQCEERGMFAKDARNQDTARFGGLEFVPSSILVKSYGDKALHVSSALDNEAKYNDFVPMIYGTGWYRPPVIFARNDGNLTHLEVLLGVGEMNSVLKLTANGVEIPAGRSGKNMTATGWFNVISLGGRTGGFNLDFKSSSGQPSGDPYGSMAVASVVVPNRISDGTSLPRIEILVEGMKLPIFREDGTSPGEIFSNNPAWILLDILRRSGWETAEIDMESFVRTAAYCDEPIETQDLYGNTRSIPRFQCNLILRKRRSVADLIRGIRNGSGLYLTYGAGGKLELRAESSILVQQPVKSDGSNSTETLDGGWPAYEFGDGVSGFSDIIRRESGEPALRIWSRSTANAPNRYTVEFQDEFNEYQQDSLSLVDFDDSLVVGQEISASLSALGLPNFNQAARIIRIQLDKAIRGNRYVEFETGVRAIGLKPGDLITLTYLKEGFDRQLFRILRISPGLNYRTSMITAQVHDELWYSGGVNGELGLIGGGRQPRYEIGLPRPLTGAVMDAHGDTQFAVEERSEESSDGSVQIKLSASFSTPAKVQTSAPGIPLLSLAPNVSPTGGSLPGGENFYYAITSVDGSDSESQTSFLVRAITNAASSSNSVTLRELSFPPGASSFHVYRGSTPIQLFRIASHAEIASSYTDLGASSMLVSPPDPNYHHANFYWRTELQPEAVAGIASANTIGNAALHMHPDDYRGQILRVTGGKGRGQERLVSGNSSTTVTLTTNWDVLPDATSTFVIAESGWRFGALTETSPAVFDVPNRENTTVHISGRSTNVNGKECAYEISPLTRHTITGAGTGPVDQDVAGAPIFGLSSPGQGIVEIVGVGFDTLANTRTVTAATLTLHYVDELLNPTLLSLGTALDSETSTIQLATAGTLVAGDLIQIDREVLAVTEVVSDRRTCTVSRGTSQSGAVAHVEGAPVYRLQQKVFILPFLRDFFGSQASGSYSFGIQLANARIASAEMWVTNSRGNSSVRPVCFTATQGDGIRTLSGGQLSMQIEGYLAIQTDAVPPLVMDATYSVRDVFATVRDAPDLAPIQARVTRNGQLYCDLTIAAGNTTSNVVSGFGLEPLAANSQIGLDVVSIGQTAESSPGRDLTITVRL